MNEVVEEFDLFAIAALTTRSPDPFPADGLTDVRVIEAIYDAADSGTRETISG